jgi:transposase-like protein
VLSPAVASQLAELVAQARADGLPVDGEGGLQPLTKIVLESSLEGEMDAHLGYGRHDPAGKNSVWPATVLQTSSVHLIRASFRYASRADWAAMAKDLKPVYTAPAEAAALDRFAEFSGKVPGSPQGAVVTIRFSAAVTRRHRHRPHGRAARTGAGCGGVRRRTRCGRS